MEHRKSNDRLGREEAERRDIEIINQHADKPSTEVEAKLLLYRRRIEAGKKGASQ